MLRPGWFMLIALATPAWANAAETNDAVRKRSAHMTDVLLSAARERVTIAGGAPKEPGGAGSDDRPRINDVVPANTIVRLPPYIVRQDKLPDAEEVLTEPELAKVAMRRYLGDEQGLDRALNVVTFKHLWKKLPVLGRYQLVDFETNEERALRIYREKKKAEQWAELAGLQRIKLQPGTGPLKNAGARGKP